MDSIELLGKLVSMDSVFPHEAELAHFLAGELERRGFSAGMQQFEKGRYNVLASREGNGKPLLLYGHMDTVPAYGYDRDPLRLQEKDGRLYGLGAYDMKAGIAAILQAIEEPCERALRVMFVSDEENDSRGCQEAVKAGFASGVEAAVVCEISDVPDINERTRTIGLGRRGRVQYEIAVPGRSVHAAHMEDGISAITEASKLALELEKMNAELPRHDKLSRGSQYVRSFQSQSVSLSVPDEARLLVDRHLVFPETIESAGKQIEERINRMYASGALREVDGRRATLTVKPRAVPYLMPYLTPENSPQVVLLGEAIRSTLGAEPCYNYGLSVADENLIAAQGVPVISYGPVGAGEHSGNEWVSKKSYLELIDVLKAHLRQ
jgi:acetylornithine deacetylase/succinyl-diaminopimelate desuccinylase-like protein